MMERYRWRDIDGAGILYALRLDGDFGYTRLMDGNQGGEMLWISVHTVNIGTVDGDSVYARSADGNRT